MQLYKDEIDKELILNAEIQRQNLKALPKAFKDRKIKSPVTQKMIDEFKQQFNKKKGDKAFLFPEYTPILIDQNDELSKLQQPLSNDQIIDATNDLNILTQDYKLLNDVMIPQYRRIISEKKEEMNKTNDLLGQKNKKNNKNLRNKKRNLEENIKELEGYIIRDTNVMKDLLSDINQIKKIIEENNEISDNYSNVKFSIEQKNKKILSDYENNIRVLNEGKISITQQPDETEQEYLERIADLANEEYDDTELIERAYLSNINEFKQNMKKILSSEWKIETILNSLDREDVFLLNKTFEMFKRQALKLYGFNNTNITPELYLELIKFHLNSLQPVQGVDAYYKKEDDKKQYKVSEEAEASSFEAPVEVEASSFEEPVEVEASSFVEPKFTQIGSEDDDIVYNLSNDEETLLMTNRMNNRSVELSLGDKSNTRVFYKLKDYGKITPFQGSSKTRTIKEKFIAVFKTYLEMTDEQIKNELDIDVSKEGFKITEQKLASIFTNIGLKYPNLDMFLGEGIKKLKEKLPAFFEFGKVIILLDKLYYKNTLSIKDKKKKNIQGIPNSKVSNEFVNIIMKMIKEEAPALKDDIYELSEKEQELFSILMYKSGFYKETPIPINNKNIIKKLKERLQLVEGTIKAGNNNTDNFKELYEIIFKMTNLGVISLSAGRNYYKEIKKEYS